MTCLNQKKEGVEEQFPKVVGKTHYGKLLNALDRRELRDFGSTMYNIVRWNNFLIKKACKAPV